MAEYFHCEILFTCMLAELGVGRCSKMFVDGVAYSENMHAISLNLAGISLGTGSVHGRHSSRWMKNGRGFTPGHLTRVCVTICRQH